MNNKAEQTILMSEGSQLMIALDPLNKYNYMEDSDILEYLGVIPQWLQDYHNAPPEMTLWDYLSGCYGFPMNPMTGGEVTETGMYKYPDDPDLSPLANIMLAEGATVLQYQYGMVAIREAAGGDWTMVRMD